MLQKVIPRQDRNVHHPCSFKMNVTLPGKVDFIPIIIRGGGGGTQNIKAYRDKGLAA